MTEDECSKLEFGDRVWTLVNRKRTLTTVVSVNVSSGSPVTNRPFISSRMYRTVVGVRRMGHKPNGRPFPKFFRLADDLELESKYSSSTANVFADFLEERGYIDAAKSLRKEFPLS